MTMFKSNSVYIGLDAGASGIKLVAVSRNKAGCELAGFGDFSVNGDGILSYDELYQSASQWLSEHHWAESPVCSGISQSMSTVLFRDFPEKVGKAALGEMIDCEIAQLSGLSDEVLSRDFCRISPVTGHASPVMIGLCREEFIREKSNSCTGCGISMHSAGLNGIALANAFLKLKNSECNNNQVQLLLDIGTENTTAVVIAGKTPIFISPLMFGGEKFEQAAKAQADELASKVLLEVNLLDEIGMSPFLLAAKLLENEIHGALESWRAQEGEELSSAIVSRVWLSGGVSRLGGLAGWLSERLETPVEVWGPKASGLMHPELATAYGLALQCANMASANLQILPEAVKFKLDRKRKKPFLIAAICLASGLLLGHDALSFISMSRRTAACEKQRASLVSCQSIIDQINSTQLRIYEKEARLVPVVIAGNQMENLKNSLKIFADTLVSDNWLVYFASDDVFSIENSKTDENDSNNDRMSAMFSMPEENTTVSAVEFPLHLTGKSNVVTNNYVLSFYAPYMAKQPFAPASAFIDTLKSKGGFKNVELLPELSESEAKLVLGKWPDFLAAKKDKFKLFTIRIDSGNAVNNGNLPDSFKKNSKTKGRPAI